MRYDNVCFVYSGLCHYMYFYSICAVSDEEWEQLPKMTFKYQTIYCNSVY